MVFNIKKAGQVIKQVKVPPVLAIPATLLFLALIVFFFWFLFYGAQLLALFFFNFLFRTHVHMSFVVWLAITVMFFVTGIYKFEINRT